MSLTHSFGRYYPKEENPRHSNTWLIDLNFNLKHDRRRLITWMIPTSVSIVDFTTRQFAFPEKVSRKKNNKCHQ